MIDILPKVLKSIIASFNCIEDLVNLSYVSSDWNSLKIYQYCLPNVILTKIGTSYETMVENLQDTVNTQSDQFEMLQEIHDILIPSQSKPYRRGGLHCYIMSKRLYQHPIPKPLSYFRDREAWYNYHFPCKREEYIWMRLHPIYRCSWHQYLRLFKNRHSLSSLLY